MARRILGAIEADFQDMLEFIDKFPDLQETPAQFQERCGQIALKRFWQEQEKKAGKPTNGKPRNGVNVLAATHGQSGM